MNREQIPPAASRADALGRLRVERWHAANAGEARRVAEIDHQIEQLSASGTPTAPTRETAASSQPRATTARTTPKPKPTLKPKPTPKGTRRVSAR